MAAAAAASRAKLQLVDGAGELRHEPFARFAKDAGLGAWGVGYQVVAIMGPQSSGKSTLLNALFGTRFDEMDAYSGRSQTTQGVWLAKAQRPGRPTLVLDLEGTDGRERGEDDTAFERQSALLAMATADVLLVNMWCHDVGREHGAGKPLLKTVFQVNLKLFTPRRTTLCFVLRDRTKTPLERLEAQLKQDLEQIWAGIAKPEKHAGTAVYDFFDVRVVTLPSFEFFEEEFTAEVAALGKRLCDPEAEDPLASAAGAGVPGDAFVLSTSSIWKSVRENKDLDLPAHRVMVATVRCGEIAAAHVAALEGTAEWAALSADASSERGARELGARAQRLIEGALADYDNDTHFFDESVRAAKRDELCAKASALMQTAFDAQVGRARTDALKGFKRALKESLQTDGVFADAVEACRADELGRFDAAAAEAKAEAATTWDAAAVRERLVEELDAHVITEQARLVAEAVAAAERGLSKALLPAVTSVLDTLPPDTWESLRTLVADVSASDGAKLTAKLEVLGLAASDVAAKRATLQAHAQELVDTKAREAAAGAALRIKSCFNDAFGKDDKGLPRSWGASDDLAAIATAAKVEAAKALAVLAVTRLGGAGGDPAAVEAALCSLARPEDGGASLPAAAWDGEEPGAVLLSPVDCRAVWRAFDADTQYAVAQARATIEAAKAASSKWPPMYAVVLIVVLGFDEFLWLLRSPFTAVFLLVVALYSRALYYQLDVEGAMAMGAVPGVVTLSSKLVPALAVVTAKLIEEAGSLVQRVAAEAAAAQESQREKAAAADAGAAASDAASASAGGGSVGSSAVAAGAPSAQGLRQRGRAADE